MTARALVFGAFLFAAAPSHAAVQSDDELRRLIVGTWVPAVGDRTSIPAKTTYREDGSIHFVGFADRACTLPSIRILGTWKIENGRLSSTVVETSAPRGLRLGEVVVDEIVSISPQEQVLRNDRGTLQRRARSTVCPNEADT